MGSWEVARFSEQVAKLVHCSSVAAAFNKLFQRCLRDQMLKIEAIPDQWLHSHWFWRMLRIQPYWSLPELDIRLQEYSVYKPIVHYCLYRIRTNIHFWQHFVSLIIGKPVVKTRKKERVPLMGHGKCNSLRVAMLVALVPSTHTLRVQCVRIQCVFAYICISTVWMCVHTIILNPALQSGECLEAGRKAAR